MALKNEILLFRFLNLAPNLRKTRELRFVWIAERKYSSLHEKWEQFKVATYKSHAKRLVKLRLYCVFVFIWMLEGNAHCYAESSANGCEALFGSEA